MNRLQCRRPGLDPSTGKSPWRRAWQPTPGFLPGESHGQRSLAGCSPRGCKESGMTERLSTAQLMWTNIYLICLWCGRPGRLACCSPWGYKEPETTWRMNSNHSVHAHGYLNSGHEFVLTRFEAIKDTCTFEWIYKDRNYPPDWKMYNQNKWRKK